VAALSGSAARGDDEACSQITLGNFVFLVFIIFFVLPE